MKRRFLTAMLTGAATMLLAAAPAPAAVSAGNTGWTWGNPLPQGNTLGELQFAGGRGYAGGLSGTLLRTDDGGSTWNGVRTGLLDTIHVVEVISPDTVVFAGTCALRRSDDGGATVRRLPWTQSDESCNPSIAAISFPNGNAGFLLLANGDVFTTADGGSSWAKRTALPGTAVTGGNAQPGAVHFMSETTGVATAGAAIYRTVDGGVSWVLENGSAPAGLADFAFTSAVHGFVVGQGKAVLQTTDGGDNWTSVPVNAGADGLDLRHIDCANSNDCIAAAGNGSALLRTTDGGVNWTAVTPSSAAIYDAGFASPTRVAAVGAGGATVISDDGGTTWTPVSTGVTGEFEELRAIDSQTALAFGPGGALARTLDGGATWHSIGVSTSAEVFDAAFPSALEGFVIDANGTLTRTVNGGASWQFLDTGVNTRPTALAAPSAMNLVLVGPKGVRISTDGGNSFGGAAGRGLSRIALSDLDRAGPLYFAYGSRSIVMSANGGKSWAAIKKPPRAKTIDDLDFVSSKAGYVLDGRGELWFTRNRGKKWAMVGTTGDTDFTSMAFGDAAHGFLASDNGRVLRTDDGGRTWSRQYPYFDETRNSPLVIDAPTASSAFAIVARTARFFSTTSGGKIGQTSQLTIKAARKVRKGAKVRVTGRLTPATGGERVSVLARPIGAKPGTRWTQVEATVAANGSFTTHWTVRRPLIFIARWSGSSAVDGDGAPPIAVRVKARR